MTHIGNIRVDPPFGLAPMAGMTDSAFRRLVKRHGGCGLVVTEMVSSEGLVRGMDRTLQYTDFTEEERPIAVQVFGGDPEVMANAARVVEETGADLVDVNMGCPVPKIAKSSAGCSLMREPARAAAIVSAMTRAVRIPVTVKMRAGWNEQQVNAPELARMLEDAGASAIAVHGRTAADSYRGHSDWELVARVVESVRIPVFGNGDLVDPAQILDRWHSSGVAGVLAGRGMLRNPWLCAQAADLHAGLSPRTVSARDRGRFLLEYIDLLLGEGIEEPNGFRHQAPGCCGQAEEGGPQTGPDFRPAAGRRERWVINKLRALSAWYTRGFENGSETRVAINRADSIGQVREIIDRFFSDQAAARAGSTPGAGAAGDHVASTTIGAVTSASCDNV